MALWLALADYRDGAGRAASAGSVLDDAIFDVSGMRAAGLAVVAYNPATMAQPAREFFAAGAKGDLVASLLAAGAIGGGGASEGSYAPVVTPIAPGTLVAAATGLWSWTRVGDHVLVGGKLLVTPAALPQDNQIDVTLPIATTNDGSIAGIANGSSAPGSMDVTFCPGIVVGAAGPARARVLFSLQFANAPVPFTMPVCFDYRVAA